MTADVTKTHFIVNDLDCICEYPTYEDAVKRATFATAGNRSGDTYGIYQLVAIATAPMPEATITKIA